jgi:hypothetical protein
MKYAFLLLGILAVFPAATAMAAGNHTPNGVERMDTFGNRVDNRPERQGDRNSSGVDRQDQVSGPRLNQAGYRYQYRHRNQYQTQQSKQVGQERRNR